MTIDGVKLYIRNKYIRETANLRRAQINKSDFTIISNNCWAGLVYESYNLPKQTPTVGMYFMAEEYIKFLSNLKHYTSCEMTFVDSAESKYRDFYAKDKRFGSFPIGVVDDVEIALLHYHSEEEAREKYKRRCERINWNNLIVKMNDQNQCFRKHVKDFLELPFEHKLFFTTRDDFSKFDGTTLLISKNKECCGLFDEPIGACKKFNVNDLINLI